MHGRWSVLYDQLRTSLWPVPLGMSLLALLLWWGTIALDAQVGPVAPGTMLLDSGNGDDARNLLTALVTSLLALAGVMFSITMVVLSLAANQFGSRLVRTYTGDPRTQVALGIFLMTVVYGILALRSVGGGMQPADVPHVTVAVAVVLAFLCLLVLLLYLTLVTRLMVADAVIERVAAELEEAVAALPHTGDGLADDDPADDDPAETAPGGNGPPDDDRDRMAIVRSCEEGYVQSVDYEALVAAACRENALIRLDYRAGAFMCRHGWLARIHPAGAMTDRMARDIQDAVRIGDRRTPTQDLEFPIRHLVDIALRALSPGINDPNTAVAVIDRLRGALARLMSRRLPDARYRDAGGRVRVLADRTGFDGIVRAAFHQIRQAGAEKPAVCIHMLGSFARLAEHVRTEEQRHSLLHHADMVAAAGIRATDEEGDRQDIEEALAATRRKLTTLIDLYPAGDPAELSGHCR